MKSIAPTEMTKIARQISKNKGPLKDINAEQRRGLLAWERKVLGGGFHVQVYHRRPCHLAKWSLTIKAACAKRSTMLPHNREKPPKRPIKVILNPNPHHFFSPPLYITTLTEHIQVSKFLNRNNDSRICTCTNFFNWWPPPPVMCPQTWSENRRLFFSRIDNRPTLVWTMRKTFDL